MSETVKVRFAVAVSCGGSWRGAPIAPDLPDDDDDVFWRITNYGDGDAEYIVEADVPIPEVTPRRVIKATEITTHDHAVGDEE